MRKCFSRLIAWVLTLVLTMSLMSSVVMAAPQQHKTTDSKDSTIAKDVAVTETTIQPIPFTGTKDLVAKMKEDQAKNPESEVVDPATVEMLHKVTASLDSKGKYSVEQVKAELEIAIFAEREETTTDVTKYNLTEEELSFLAGLVLKENSASLLVTLTFTTNAEGIATAMKVKMSQVYEKGLDSLDKIDGVGKFESSTTDTANSEKDTSLNASSKEESASLKTLQGSKKTSTTGNASIASLDAGSNESSTSSTSEDSAKQYGNPSFQWANNNTECTAVFVCAEDGSTLNKSCVVTSETTAATCTVEGNILYKAECVLNNETYLSQRRVILEPKHEYNAPEFVWTRTTDGDFTCTANFTCKNCEKDSSVECVVTAQQNEEGNLIYTGSCSFYGKSYTDEYNATTKQLYADWATLCEFYRNNAEYYGVAADYWTSKNTDADPMGAIKELVGYNADEPVPASYMDQIITGMVQAFTAYVQYYGSYLLQVRDDALSRLDDKMTDLQKALVLHDYLADKASFDMSSLAKMQNGESNPDLIEMTPFGALLTGTVQGVDGCVCIGYTAAYAYLIQSAHTEIYKDANGNFKTSDQMREEDSGIVDFAMIKYDVDTAEASVAGAESGFAGRFTQSHYFNALEIDGQWYYVDTCYDDIEPETMSQYRVETDGNLHHMYFLYSQETMEKMYDGYYQYINTLHKEGAKACNSKKYEDVWFSKVDSAIYYDDNYWYYVEGAFSYSQMIDYMDQNSEIGNGMGDSTSGMMDDPQYADKLKRRPRSTTDETSDTGVDVLLNYGDGTVMNVADSSTAVDNWVAGELSKDKAYNNIFPELSHSIALHNNIIFFNVGNKIVMYDLSTSKITQLKEYNDVYAVSNGKDFTGMSFVKAAATADDIQFKVVNHPIAAISIKGDGNMYVTIATNFSNSKESKYKVESVNFNPDYNQYTSDKNEDTNDNSEFMWCANVAETMSLTDIDTYLNNQAEFSDVTVAPWCEEQGFTEPRDTVCGCSDGLHKYESSLVDALPHHYAYNDTEECNICYRCYGVLDEEDTTTETGHNYDAPVFKWEQEDYTYRAFVTLHCSTCDKDKTVECDVTRDVDTAAGIVTYHATCTVDGNNYSDSKEEPNGDEYSFSNPDYKWTAKAGGGYDCTATFTCTDLAGVKDPFEVTKTCVVSYEDTSSCTEAGTVTYNASCRFNGEVYDTSRTENGVAIGHAYGSPKFQWGQDSAGNVVCGITLTCSRCQVTLQDQCTVSEGEMVYPTCTEKGSATYNASYSIGDTTYSDTLKVDLAPAHYYQDPVFTWSNNEDGNMRCSATFTCAYGDATKTVECNVATTSIEEATCEGDGKATYTASCIVNSRQYTDTKSDQILAAKGHTFDRQDYSWKKDSNGNMTCQVTYTCSSCQESETSDCDVTTDSFVAPTCTTNGNYKYTASHTFDGKNYVAVNSGTIDALGHVYSQPTAIWSDVDGQVTCDAVVTCSRCGNEAIEHCLVTVKHEDNTCTKDGYNEYTASCTINGQVFSDVKTDTIAMSGHLYKQPVFSWSKDSNNQVTCTAQFVCEKCNDIQNISCLVTEKTNKPTCTVNGSIEYKATVNFNGKDFTDTKTESILATGHELVYKDNGNGTCTETCKNCNYSQTRVIAPATPKNVKATVNSYNSVKISWSSVPGATLYRVYQKEGSSWKSVAETKTTSCIIYNLNTGVNYQYKVQALNSAGESTTNSYVQVKPMLNTPIVKATSASYNSIKISWGKVSGASGYYVYVKSGDSWKRITTINSGKTDSYIHKALVCNTTYQYRVIAYRKVGKTIVNSSYNKDVAKAKPMLNTPTVKATSASYNSIKISWGKVSGASGYYVYVKSGNSWKRIKTITSGKTNSYIHKALVCNTTYQYRVIAYRKVGKTIVNSSYSKVITKAKPTLGTVTLVKVNKSKSSVYLQWKKVAGATGYYIYRRTGNAEFKIVKKITNGSTSWNNKGLKSNSKYNYIIVAYRLEKGKTVKGTYKYVNVKTNTR